MFTPITLSLEKVALFDSFAPVRLLFSNSLLTVHFFGITENLVRKRKRKQQLQIALGLHKIDNIKIDSIRTVR
jgi:hypothetical protein